MRRLSYNLATELLDAHEHLFPPCFFDEISEYEVSRGSFAFVWSHPTLNYIIKATSCPYNVQYLSSLSLLSIPTYTETDAFITFHLPTPEHATPEASPATSTSYRTSDSTDTETPLDLNPAYLISWCQMPLGIPHHKVSGAVLSSAQALSAWLNTLHKLALQSPYLARTLLQHLPEFQTITLPTPLPAPPTLNLTHLCHEATLLTFEIPENIQLQPLHTFTNSDLLALPPTLSKLITTYRKWTQKTPSLHLSPIQKTVLLDCYHAAALTYPELYPYLDSMHDNNLLLLPITALNSDLLPPPLPLESTVLFPHDLLFEPLLLKTLHNATSATLLIP